MTRYWAYQAHRAGHGVAQVFGQVTTFLGTDRRKAAFTTSPGAL
jgi:hypothetical protein